jgi:hypothetical protein
MIGFILTGLKLYSAAYAEGFLSSTPQIYFVVYFIYQLQRVVSKSIIILISLHILIWFYFSRIISLLRKIILDLGKILFGDNRVLFF